MLALCSRTILLVTKVLEVQLCNERGVGGEKRDLSSD